MKTLLSLGLRHAGNELSVLDQRALPHEENWILIKHPQQMIEAIHGLAVRGAPLIGVAAALSLAKFAESGASIKEFQEWAKKMREARPTAVNLMKAVDLLLSVEPYSSVVTEAEKFFEADVQLCEALANKGSQFINDGDQILTHCNTGGLATAGIGTALGVIQKAHQEKKKIHVFVDETRPLLQGARLTTWELQKLKIPFTLIGDSMAASLMQQRKINKIFVGADRIAANGDVANKIGTYSLAVLAKFHEIPFYVVAPKTTVDNQTATGSDIPIEFREPSEVRGSQALKNCEVYNPSFDVTPRSLITEIIVA